MSDHTASQRGTRILISAAALVIIIFVVHQAESVVALFVWSVFIALLGVPPVLWLKRKRVPPFPAVLLVMTCMIALLLILGGVLGASLSTFSNALMLTGWYKAPKSSEEADVIYERVADILHLSFPDQNFTADNLEIRGENLEVYVVSPQKSMRNLEPATNRVIIKRDDVVVMPLEYLAEIK